MKMSQINETHNMCDLNYRQTNDEQIEYKTEKRIIKTSDIYVDAAKDLPTKFEYPHLLNGYGVEKGLPNKCYTKTSSDYGWYKPNQHTVPYKYFPKGQRFTNVLAKCGMYKNFSLNMT